MAGVNETTTKFKVDISELKKSMQEAKRSVAVANSEFKAVASTMDDWSKSSDGLKAKLTQLDTNLNAQKSILNDLEKQYEITVAEMGEGSKAADDLRIKINNQKAVVGNTEREINKYSDTLETVSQAEKTAAKTGKDVADVLDEMGKEAEDAESGFTVLKGTIATFAGNALSSLAGGIKDLIGNFMSLADETREYRTEMAKLDSAFESAGHNAAVGTVTFNNLYDVLGDEGQATEAAAMLAKLCDTEQELQEWTTIATGVYGTFGASLPIESLAEAANETAKTGALTGALADALNWAGVNEESFQESLDGCATEQERQALITETLNGLYAETGKAYRENNADLIAANKSQRQLTDVYADFGAIAEPIMSKVKSGAGELLNAILELVEGADFNAIATAVEDGFGYLTYVALPAIQEGFQWILDNKDYLIAGLAGIASGFVAFKVAGLITSITSALSGMTVATALAAAKQWLLNSALLANPIGLVVALIAGLAAAFVVLWKKSDTFREFWIDLWDKIKEYCSLAKDWIGEKINEIGRFFTETIPEFFQSLLNWIKSNWQNLLLMLINPFAGLFKYFYENNYKFREFVDTAVNHIKELPSKIWVWLLNTITQVMQWGEDLKAKGREAAQKLLEAVVEKVKEIPAKMLSIGADIVHGVWDGINGATQWIKDKISGWVGNVTDFLKNLFGIASPSKLMRDEIGRWIPEGIAVGIDKNAKSVMSSMRDLTYGTVGAVRDGLTTVSGASVGGGVVNNFTQVINSPKQLNRLDIYRQSKNLLGYAGGGL